MGKKVEVNFIDAESGKPLFKAKMPVEELPESFEEATTLHLANEEWQVLKAEPTTASEYVKKGKLNLVIRKRNIQSLKLEEILFSLPTISDKLAEVQKAPAKLDKGSFTLHYDFWRQIEFVSNEYQDLVEAEFTEIIKIYREASTNGAFRRIHLRKLIEEPVAKQISLSKFYNSFPVQPAKYNQIGYENVAGVIKDGFAFKVEGLFNLYGEAPGDTIKVLALAFDRSNKVLSAQTIQFLAAFMNANDLSLVDWLGLRRVRGNIEEIGNYFKPAPV
ncbi:MAG TPA: hypothetical protein VH186_10590 [Chloroflexia bacterium]|nr:hypothetical protein [Chloroflexia bacterium]